MSTRTVDNPKIVSREGWIEARKKLLAREKQLTHERDAVAAERRKLPWVKVEKNYVFDSPSGKKTLADLFNGKSQLVVYHLMFGPEWQEACPSCSFNMDHTDGALVHLAQRDVSFAAVSRAPLPKIEAFKKRMGWKFNWVSSYGSDFNNDYHVSFTPEQLAQGKVEYNFELTQFPGAEAPGISVFYKDKDGNIFHTYSTYARGTETTINAYNYLDYVPKGRDEDDLRFTMSWLRHHDRYESGKLADADLPYWPADAARQDHRTESKSTRE
ncbi:MAG TPA: thioredoxin family protein [Terriglobia bacterium]|nr:thioredoxin family protein [Terriglobia bacterium]